jgi:hypothetical protein
MTSEIYTNVFQPLLACGLKLKSGRFFQTLKVKLNVFFQSLTPHNSIEFQLKCYITNERGGGVTYFIRRSEDKLWETKKSVSGERQSVVTERRPSRFEIYGNTRRIALDRVDGSSTVTDSNLPGLNIHPSYQTYLNRQLNRPSTTNTVNGKQPPSYEFFFFGSRQFFTSPA